MNQETPPILVVLAGPAGSGKTTLCDRTVQEDPEFSRVVTTTTRAPRKGEIDGVSYHFFSPPKFRQQVADGAFLEYAPVHGTDENRLYGTLMRSVVIPLNRGENLIMNVNVDGVRSFRRAAKTYMWLNRALVTVYINVNRQELEARMHARGQDHPDEIARRLQTAEAEFQEIGIFEFVIESKTRDEDFASLLAIIEKARQRISA